MYFNFVCVALTTLCYVLVHNVRVTFADPTETDVLPAMEVGVANLLPAKDDEDTDCVVVDGLCLMESDLSSYEAIRSLHNLLDDDMSGEIDMTESVDFLMEELTITDGYNSRQKNLHHNSDSYISVRDLWHMWKSCEVHNWTVEQTVQWLTDVVGLPQYSEAFVAHAINGSYLPSLVTIVGWSKGDEPHSRLTMNKGNYLGSVLGIKGLSHRTKVTVKAMDAVLFGPPKGSHLKDYLIAGLVSVIMLGLTYIIMRNHKMRQYHTQLIMQIEDLQQEEIKYRNHLQKAKQDEKEQQATGRKRSHVPSDIPDSRSNVIGGGGGDHVSDVSSNDGEGGSISAATRGVEPEYGGDYDSNIGSETPPNEYSAHLDRASLEHWLQLTYQKEKAVVDSKRRLAQSQIVKASEICVKLRAQGKNPLNLFSLMHGKMDNVEKTISLARAGMHEVQRDEKERQERWGEIERLMDCNIRQLADLHNVMGSYTSLQTNSTNPAESSNIGTSPLPSATGSTVPVSSTSSSSSISRRISTLTSPSCKTSLSNGGGNIASVATITAPISSISQQDRFSILMRRPHARGFAGTCISASDIFHLRTNNCKTSLRQLQEEDNRLTSLRQRFARSASHAGAISGSSSRSVTPARVTSNSVRVRDSTPVPSCATVDATTTSPNSSDNTGGNERRNSVRRMSQ